MYTTVRNMVANVFHSSGVIAKWSKTIWADCIWSENVFLKGIVFAIRLGVVMGVFQMLGNDVEMILINFRLF